MFAVQQEGGGGVARAEGEGHLGNALLNVHTHNDGVLLVKDAGRQDAQDAGEHRIKLGCFLLFIFHLNRPCSGQLWCGLVQEPMDTLVFEATPTLMIESAGVQDKC